MLNGRHLRPSSLDLIEVGLQLSNPPKLDIEIVLDLSNLRFKFATHVVDNLTTLVEEIDDAVEFSPCDVDRSGFWNATNLANSWWRAWSGQGSERLPP